MKFFIILPLLFLQGCLGCGGGKEMMLDAPLMEEETEEERVRRLALEIVREIKLMDGKAVETVPSSAPQPLAASIPGRRAFGITDVSAAIRLISFMADSATVARMNPGRFGHVRQLSIVDGPDRWELKVDARYKFDEVVIYLRNFE